MLEGVCEGVTANGVVEGTGEGWEAMDVEDEGRGVEVGTTLIDELIITVLLAGTLGEGVMLGIMVVVMAGAGLLDTVG